MPTRLELPALCGSPRRADAFVASAHLDQEMKAEEPVLIIDMSNVTAMTISFAGRLLEATLGTYPTLGVVVSESIQGSDRIYLERQADALGVSDRLVFC